MRIAIVGCGAMGTVMGALMTKNGMPVDMVDIYKAHVDALNATGAKIVGRMNEVVPVHALTPDQMEGIYDIIFLFTKQTANDDILPIILKHIDENSTVCTLQNGVPEPYVASYVGENRTVGGTVLWGATFMGPGESEITQDITLNDHLFEIGEMNGEITDRIKKVAEVLGYVGRPTHITDQLMNSRWGKLILNACMSGMSAVGGCTFGEVLGNRKAKACLSYIGHEVKMCCEASGHKLPDVIFNGATPETFDLVDQAMFDANQETFEMMYKDMHTAKASMLQDLEKDRKSEVSMLDGYVSMVGDQYGIDTPFADKVVEIVKGIEDHKLPLNLSNVELFPDEMFKFEMH